MRFRATPISVSRRLCIVSRSQR